MDVLIGEFSKLYVLVWGSAEFLLMQKNYPILWGFSILIKWTLAFSVLFSNFFQVLLLILKQRVLHPMKYPKLKRSWHHLGSIVFELHFQFDSFLYPSSTHKDIETCLWIGLTPHINPHKQTTHTHTHTMMSLPSVSKKFFTTHSKSIHSMRSIQFRCGKNGPEIPAPALG